MKFVTKKKQNFPVAVDELSPVGTISVIESPADYKESPDKRNS